MLGPLNIKHQMIKDKLKAKIWVKGLKSVEVESNYFLRMKSYNTNTKDTIVTLEKLLEMKFSRIKL